MQDYQHVNKYKIEFSEHATHTGWNDAALYGEFYRGLAEHFKDQLLSLDHPQMFQQLKADALKCDTRHWECQGKKTANLWSEQAVCLHHYPIQNGDDLHHFDRPAQSSPQQLR